MSKASYRSLPTDYSELISELKKRIEQCEIHLKDFEHRHYNGTRENAVIYCLNHAIDLAKGCLATALENLPDSLATLSRAILEALFWARYVTLSTENAQEFTDSTKNELKRIAKKNLSAGYGRIRNIKTNEDKTKEFLESPLMKDVSKRIFIESVAKQGGLERVYTTIYAFISMIAHGRAFNLRATTNNKDEFYASISATLGALQCIDLITSDWITHRKQTKPEIITELLGI